jgi:hypothetical protein
MDNSAMHRVLLASTIVLALIGCQSKPVDAKEIAARIAQAKQIGNASERNEALVAVSREAAGAGLGKATMEALGAIEEQDLHDRVSEECAIYLRNAGQRQAAKDVAERIGSSVKRAEMLKKLATG